ncbi:MAG: hypothetical protein ABIG88_02435 [Patescibacteria group bacterium]|nr:hypothetical protein [Patescibacteria group bacterium]
MDIDITKKVILYLVNEMGSLVGGSPKMMKMMFLIEHYDPNKGELVKRGLLDNVFVIHHQGVFSNDVMHCFNDLVSGGKIEDRFPLKANTRSEFRLGYKERIDNIIDEFKTIPNYDLEDTILTMLGIDPYHKQEHYGTRVRDLIKVNLLEEEKKAEEIE